MCGPLVILCCLLVRVPHLLGFTPSVATADVEHHVSCDAMSSSKCVQTDEQQIEQVSDVARVILADQFLTVAASQTNLQPEIRSLQRDKW